MHYCSSIQSLKNKPYIYFLQFRLGSNVRYMIYWSFMKSSPKFGKNYFLEWKHTAYSDLMCGVKVNVKSLEGLAFNKQQKDDYISSYHGHSSHFLATCAASPRQWVPGKLSFRIFKLSFRIFGIDFLRISSKIKGCCVMCMFLTNWPYFR